MRLGDVRLEDVRCTAAHDITQLGDDAEVEAVALADDIQRDTGPLASLDKRVGHLMTRESDDADGDGGLRMSQLAGDRQQVLRRAGDGARFHERENPDGRCMTAGFELPFRAQAISSSPDAGSPPHRPPAPHIRR